MVKKHKKKWLLSQTHLTDQSSQGGRQWCRRRNDGVNPCFGIITGSQHPYPPTEGQKRWGLPLMVVCNFKNRGVGDPGRRSEQHRNRRRRRRLSLSLFQQLSFSSISLVGARTGRLSRLMCLYNKLICSKVEDDDLLHL
ncbi:hypothetical protein HanIR_Chr12g0573281 [Helianthus annuus]|nr:hypothetical protein HanIR_Chr12g0573281 [Helianthus annuus]